MAIVKQRSTSAGFERVGAKVALSTAVLLKSMGEVRRTHVVVGSEPAVDHHLQAAVLDRAATHGRLHKPQRFRWAADTGRSKRGTTRRRGAWHEHKERSGGGTNVDDNSHLGLAVVQRNERVDRVVVALTYVLDSVRHPRAQEDP